MLAWRQCAWLLACPFRPSKPRPPRARSRFGIGDFEMASPARDAMPVAPAVTRTPRQSARAPSRWLPVRGPVAPHRSRLIALLSGLLLLLGYAFLSHRPWVS